MRAIEVQDKEHTDMNKKRTVPRIPVAIGLAMLGLAMNSGCQVSDSLADGFYGGLSSVVSTVLSDAILGTLRGG